MRSALSFDPHENVASAGFAPPAGFIFLPWLFDNIEAGLRRELLVALLNIKIFALAGVRLFPAIR